MVREAPVDKDAEAFAKFAKATDEQKAPFLASAEKQLLDGAIDAARSSTATH